MQQGGLRLWAVAGPNVSRNTKDVTVARREGGRTNEMTVRVIPTEHHIREDFAALETTRRL